jgi:1-acyl-sn-glycerol-3-phosphate acyltransferase
VKQNGFDYPYPRRRPIRYALRRLARLSMGLLTDFKIVGRENLPESGPLIVVANHFHYADTVAVVAATRWPMEFLGGHHLVDAPLGLAWIPRLWGYFAVHRGAVSRNALRASSDVLDQGGVLAVFPEGGSWADVLRPARPGAAYLAVETGVSMLPIGLDGLPDIFPFLRRGKRATVTVRIGRPFGPFRAQGRGRRRRARLEKIGREIMQQIARLIPPGRRGVFSSDPEIRTEAQEAAVYPFDDPDKRGW